MKPCFKPFKTILIGLLAWQLLMARALAGGGAETTLLVINSASALSQTVANSYIKLRDLPDSHVLWLDNIPSLNTLEIEDFRARILGPINDHLARYDLGDQIDTITYSADFPYAVNFQKDVEAYKLKKNKIRGRIASLTGLTYFARRVAVGDIGYLGPYSNQYYRRNLAAVQPRLKPYSADEDKSLQTAAQAFNREDYAQAQQIYSSLLQNHPGRSQLWYNLARSLAAMARIDEAAAALDRAVNSGWKNSLKIDNDPYLQQLRTHPHYPVLLQGMQEGNGPFEPAQGFRSRYQWNRYALPMAESLDRYYLSTLLAYSGIQGNSVPEIMHYLSQAAASDGSQPQGTVYLMENDNVRAETRQRYFATTVTALEQHGRKAEVLRQGVNGQDGRVPRDRPDVIGLVAGSDRYWWSRSNSRLLPGAIAESLTSYGGHFEKDFQTKLSEFLRYGAAGSSGAVAEPFSIQEKFPNSMLHVYYADGCSLAEAFYQSIASPYQLLIVGDPLARPFAHFAKISLEVSAPEQHWQGSVVLRPRVIPAPGHSIDHLELWLDGRHLTDMAPGSEYLWDTTSYSDGAHELRLVAVEAGAIETRSYHKQWITLANTGKVITIDHHSSAVVYGKTFEISGGISQPVQHVELLQGTRVLGRATIEDGRWYLRQASNVLGLGEVTLHARAHFADGAKVRSLPITIVVKEPPLQVAIPDNMPNQAGLLAQIQYMDGHSDQQIITKLDGRLLGKHHQGQVKTITLSGEFLANGSGFSELIFNSHGQLKIRVDGRDYPVAELNNQQPEVYLPLFLEQGWHTLRLELIPQDKPYLKGWLTGAQAGSRLSDKQLRHPTPHEPAP